MGASFGQWQWAPTSFMSAAHRDDASPHLLTAVEMVEDRWGVRGLYHEVDIRAAHDDDSARVRRQHRRNHRVVGRAEGQTVAVHALAALQGEGSGGVNRGKHRELRPFLPDSSDRAVGNSHLHCIDADCDACARRGLGRGHVRVDVDGGAGAGDLQRGVIYLRVPPCSVAPLPSHLQRSGRASDAGRVDSPRTTTCERVAVVADDEEGGYAAVPAAAAGAARERKRGVVVFEQNDGFHDETRREGSMRRGRRWGARVLRREGKGVGMDGAAPPPLSAQPLPLSSHWHWHLQRVVGRVIHEPQGLNRQQDAARHVDEARLRDGAVRHWGGRAGWRGRGCEIGRISPV